jgi:hypothetical protein
MKFKLFTIDAPSKETNEDGSLTNYEINRFLNENDITPHDISAEYNEASGKMLVSIGYYEGKSFVSRIVNFLKNRGPFQIRFSELYNYSEKGHTVYIQLQLENAVNYNEHATISHGVYVEQGIAKVVFLEHKNKTEDKE